MLQRTQCDEAFAFNVDLYLDLVLVLVGEEAKLAAQIDQGGLLVVQLESDAPESCAARRSPNRRSPQSARPASIEPSAPSSTKRNPPTSDHPHKTANPEYKSTD
jgi:hypothetical protein